MQAIIRKDDQAVSPVIATILMVAITVVLAAVLYVMVSGLLVGPQQGPRVMGITHSLSADGTNWTVSIIDSPQGLTTSGTRLTIFDTGGGTALAATPFANLAYGTNGVAYIAETPTPDGVIETGERLNLRTSTYLSGFVIEISDAQGILATRTL